MKKPITHWILFCDFVSECREIFACIALVGVALVLAVVYGINAANQFNAPEAIAARENTAKVELEKDRREKIDTIKDALREWSKENQKTP